MISGNGSGAATIIKGKDQQRFDTHKATRPDYICPHLLKEPAIFIAPISLFLLSEITRNKSRRSWVGLPYQMAQKGSHCPVNLFKDGDKYDPASYRLFSLTCDLVKSLLTS